MADQPIRILSTRPLEAALLEQAAGNGVLIDTLPFILTELVVEPALHDQLLELSRRPLVAVFTSMNAVEALALHLGLTVGGEAANIRPAAVDRLTGINTRPAAGWQIYCMGYATQQLVRRHFGENSIVGTAASATALAAVIVGQQAIGQPVPGRADALVGQPPDAQNNAPRELFFFCGDQRRDELPEKLRQQGIRVNEWVVYRTKRTPHKVEAVYDGVIFFSPSAVHSFFTANALPAGTLLFAIGETTAGTIRSYTSNRILLSGSPEKEALIRQVIDHYNIKL
ncbi:MAG TPA: uroporphyrinogen-III synthase [Puia sp.]|nr:uroporphyrinogen-III synthase [Puia sp.]